VAAVTDEHRICGEILFDTRARERCSAHPFHAVREAEKPDSVPL